MGLFLYVLSVLSGHSGFLPCSKSCSIGLTETLNCPSVWVRMVCVLRVFILLKIQLYYSRSWQFLKLLKTVMWNQPDCDVCVRWTHTFKLLLVREFRKLILFCCAGVADCQRWSRNEYKWWPKQMQEWVSVAENKNPRAHRTRWAASHHQEIWRKPRLLCEGARLLIWSANKPPALSPPRVCAFVCSGMWQHVCMRASINARRGNDRMGPAIAGFSNTPA